MRSWRMQRRIWGRAKSEAMMAKAEYLCRIGDKVGEVVSPVCVA